MKRRKPTKMTDVVHSGWMIKSPPERKLNAPFKIFRSQWKKRYFVLRKPSGSLPDQYELHYYKDEHCNAKKGSIDLDQCEQIIEALDSDIFPNLLAIKTYYKNKVRTYYLAVDTEQEMNSWVQWLCHVCGLKPEDQPTDIPDPKPQSSSQTGVPAGSLHPGQSIYNGRPASPTRPNQTSIAGAPSPLTLGDSLIVDSQPLPRTSSDSSLSYIPLERCTTGRPQTNDRRESVESVPDFQAPAPPQKQGNHNNHMPASDDEVFVPGLYDCPPRPVEAPNRNVVSDLYKVPPVRPSGPKPAEDDGEKMNYDFPPTRSHSPRSSLSACTDSVASGSGEPRAVTPTECYDYPPPRHDSTTSSDSEIPPERPPKPSHLQSPYQNLPPAQRLTDADLMSRIPAPPKPHTISQQTGYDVPRSSSHRPSRTQQIGLSVITSAPPRPHRSTLPTHTYLNTQNRPGSGEARLAGKLGAEGGVDRDNDKTDGGPPPIPPSRGGSAGEPLDGSLYQSPPSSSASSSSSGAPGRPPARVPPSAPQSHNQAQSPEDNAAVIFSTQRTRSFKKHHTLNNSPKLGHKVTSSPMPVPVPVHAPRPVLSSRPKDISTSDEEEEAMARLTLNDQEEETHHPLSLLHSVPAPSSDNERELKYIDLALPDAGQEPQRSSHSHGHTHSHLHSHGDRNKESATEYREIDFVKTQALNDAKRVKEKERKIDEH